VQQDFTGAIVESDYGEVLSVPIERIRFAPPPQPLAKTAG
jgi:hypothetical protein